MGISDMSKKYEKSMNECETQTDPSAYIRFACNLFLHEIVEAIKDEKELRE